MKTRKLGNSGLEVSALGMGCMNLSFGTGKPADINDGIKVIRSAFDKGITFSKDDLKEIEEGLANITIRGARLNEGLLGLSEE